LDLNISSAGTMVTHAKRRGKNDQRSRNTEVKRIPKRNSKRLARNGLIPRRKRGDRLGRVPQLVDNLVSSDIGILTLSESKRACSSLSSDVWYTAPESATPNTWPRLRKTNV
jgi:hypothetical protein